jgi:2'-5' RNA ligase
MRMLGFRRTRRFHDRFISQSRGPFGGMTDRLFFAVLPDAEARERIIERRERLRAAHGLTGRLLRPELLHVTLFKVGDSMQAPTDGVVEALTERASTVVMPKFKVAFDRAKSFSGGAYALASDEGTIGLDVLHQRLTDAFLRKPRLDQAYTPHVTMLRDPHVVPEEDIEPISWTASEMVLVHSKLGRTRHNHLARIPLG